MYCMYLNPTHRVANKLVSLSLSLTNGIPNSVIFIRDDTTYSCNANCKI